MGAPPSAPRFFRRPKGKPSPMVVAISAQDAPSLLGLNPYVPQKLAMAKVLLQQRHPILEVLRGDRLVRRILGDIYPYSYDVDAAIRGRGGASVLQCGGFVIYGYPKVTGTSIVMIKERRTWHPIARPTTLLRSRRTCGCPVSRRAGS